MQRCVSLSISGKAVTLNEKYFEDFYHMLILQKKYWSSLLAFPPSQCYIITSLFSVSMDLPILNITTWGTHTMGDLCDWGLLSLSPMLECVSALHSFLYCGLILFHGVAIVRLLIHPSVSISLGYFHIFTVRNYNSKLVESFPGRLISVFPDIYLGMDFWVIWWLVEVWGNFPHCFP